MFSAYFRIERTCWLAFAAEVHRLKLSLNVHEVTSLRLLHHKKLQSIMFLHIFHLELWSCSCRRLKVRILQIQLKLEKKTEFWLKKKKVRILWIKVWILRKKLNPEKKWKTKSCNFENSDIKVVFWDQRQNFVSDPLSCFYDWTVKRPRLSGRHLVRRGVNGAVICAAPAVLHVVCQTPPFSNQDGKQEFPAFSRRRRSLNSCCFTFPSQIKSFSPLFVSLTS